MEPPRLCIRSRLGLRGGSASHFLGEKFLDEIRRDHDVAAFERRLQHEPLPDANEGSFRRRSLFGPRIVFPSEPKFDVRRGEPQLLPQNDFGAGGNVVGGLAHAPGLGAAKRLNT